MSRPLARAVIIKQIAYSGSNLLPIPVSHNTLMHSQSYNGYFECLQCRTDLFSQCQSLSGLNPCNYLVVTLVTHSRDLLLGCRDETAQPLHTKSRIEGVMNAATLTIIATPSIAIGSRHIRQASLRSSYSTDVGRL